ncbi:hypothetical protein [Planctomycetes bacterium TBK1r]|uniref:hypothetical protein n=1 Tax=Stieleria magnilauensis TaxID=2527963 RepID=UPI00119FE1E2
MRVRIVGVINQAEGQFNSAVDEMDPPVVGALPESTAPLRSRRQALRQNRSSGSATAILALEASHQLRLAIRGVIAVLCVVAVFLFLFFPEFSGYATLSLPMLVVAFMGLRFFGRTARLMGAVGGRFSRRRRGRLATAVVSSVSSFVLKGFIGFLLASAAVIGSTYELPYVGFVAVVLLLAAVLSNYPGRGLFPGMRYEERRERLRRQSQEALACASFDALVAPRESFRRVDGNHLCVTPVSMDFKDSALDPSDGIDIEYDEVEIEEDDFFCDGYSNDYRDDYRDAPPQLHVIGE